MTMIILLLILMMGGLLRLLFVMSYSSDEDVSRVLLQRQSGAAYVTYQVPDSIVPGYYGYPMFFHFLIAKFPPHWRWHAGIVVNILSDLVTAAVLFVAVHHYIGQSGLVVDYGHLASLLYVTSPILLPVTSRMKTIKGRSFGALLSGGFFVALYAMETHGVVLAGVAAAVLFYLITITSMFAFQTVLLLSIFLAPLWGALSPLLIAGGVMALSIAVPFLRSREPLAFYFHHKLWYLRNAQNATTASHRRPFYDLMTLPVRVFRRPLKTLAHELTQQPITILILSAPELVVVGLGWPFWLADNGVFFYAAMLTLATGVVFLCVLLRSLSFLGQAERYFEYTLPFIVFLCVYCLSRWFPAATVMSISLILVLCHLTVTLLNFFVSNPERFQGKSRGDDGFSECVDYLKTHYTGGNVLTIPVKLGFKAASLIDGEGFRFYYKFMKQDKDTGFRYYENDTNGLIRVRDHYLQSKEIFSLTPAKMKEKYKADFLIVRKTEDILAGLRQMWQQEYARTMRQSDFENRSYIVLRLSRGRCAAT